SYSVLRDEVLHHALVIAGVAAAGRIRVPLPTFVTAGDGAVLINGEALARLDGKGFAVSTDRAYETQRLHRVRERLRRGNGSAWFSLREIHVVFPLQHGAVAIPQALDGEGLLDNRQVQVTAIREVQRDAYSGGQVAKGYVGHDFVQ